MSSEIESYHLVGRVEGSDSTWIQALKVDLMPEVLSDFDTAVLFHLCFKAGCVPCCTIRSRRDPDGNLEYFHGFFKNPDNPSPEDSLAMNNALLRIVTNFDERAAQRIAEDAAVLAELDEGAA